MLITLFTANEQGDLSSLQLLFVIALQRVTICEQTTIVTNCPEGFFLMPASSWYILPYHYRAG